MAARACVLQAQHRVEHGDFGRRYVLDPVLQAGLVLTARAVVRGHGMAEVHGGNRAKESVGTDVGGVHFYAHRLADEIH